MKKYLNSNIYNYIIYLAKDKDNTSQNDVKSNTEIKFFLKNKFYSEISTKSILIEASDYYEVTDHKDNLILLRNYKEAVLNFAISHLFLLKKFKDICLKGYSEKIICYKIYFIKKKGYYDLIIVSKEKKENFIGEFIYIKKFLKYCRQELLLKINNITYEIFPFDWKNISKNNFKDNNKTPGKKFFANKLSQKQILENELEDDLYSGEDSNNEEDGDYYSDNN